MFTPKIRKRLAMAAPLLMLGLVGCGGGAAAADPTPSPATFAMTGTIEPYGTNFPDNAGPTKGSDGEYDLNLPEEGEECTADAVVLSGDDVTVTDASGKVIALAKLGPGVYSNDDTASFCRFTFSVPAVPEGSDFYGVKIGQSDVVQFARSAAERPAFKVNGSAHGNP